MNKIIWMLLLVGSSFFAVSPASCWDPYCRPGAPAPMGYASLSKRYSVEEALCEYLERGNHLAISPYPILFFYIHPESGVLGVCVRKERRQQCYQLLMKEGVVYALEPASPEYVCQESWERLDRAEIVRVWRQLVTGLPDGERLAVIKEERESDDCDA